jgi:hypothetical protein
MTSPEYVTLKFGPEQRYELHIPVPARQEISVLRQALLDCFFELGDKIDYSDPKQMTFSWHDAA